MIVHGKSLVLGDDVNTDALHPSKFFSLDPSKVRSGFLGAIGAKEGQEPRGDLVIAGQNFGCGSSRETGAKVFQLVGIKAVVATSFARIFQRNLINLGLLALECPALQALPPGQLEDGQKIEVDLRAGRLILPTQSLPLSPLDPLHRAIIDAGGLLGYLGVGL